MKFITCILAFVISGFCAYAQKEIGELLSDLKNAKTVESKIEAYSGIHKYYEYSNPDSANWYTDRGLKEFRAGESDLGVAAMTVLQAFMDSYQGRILMAKEKHKSALAIYQKIGNRRGVAAVHNGLGVLDIRTGNYAKATEHFMEALKLFEELNDMDGVVNTYLKLGAVNEQSNNLSKALDYYNKGIEQLERKPSPGTSLIDIYNNIGIVYAKMNDLDKAGRYFDQALAGSTRPEYIGVRIKTLNNLGILYDKLNNDKKALGYFDEALRITRDKNLAEDFVRTTVSRASVISKSDPATAIETLKEALKTAKAIGQRSLQADIYDNMGDTYERLGKYKEALEILSLLRVLEDSIINIDKDKEMMNLQAVYDLEKTNTKLTQAEYKNEKNELIRNFTIGIAIILATVLVLLLLMYKKSAQLNDKLRKREAELQKLNEIKDRLFSIIGHDLRGPIGNLPVMLELLNDAKTTQDERNYIKNSLVTLSKSSIETLDKLLYWGQAQIKGIGIKQVMFAAGAHMRDSLELIKLSAEQKQIVIVNNVAPDTIVFADPSHFDFILRNLIANAVKFTHAGGSVTISAERSSRPGFVVFAVTDTGVGIDPDKLTDIFEPFGVSTRGTADEKGNSIGLMLCKEFVTENGGAIWVETKEGKGSTFYFSLKANENGA